MILVTPAPTITPAERAYLEACLSGDSDAKTLRAAVIRERLEPELIQQGFALFELRKSLQLVLDGFWDDCRDRGLRSDDIGALYDEFEKAT